MMSVSVVTVCYNEIDTISRCVESVFAQNYANIQYIVIDGRSQDGTAELLLGYESKFDSPIIEKDDGIYSAMNKALALCSGELVYFLNADDYFYSNTVVENVVKICESYPETDIVSGRVSYFNTPLRDGRPYSRDNFAYCNKLELYGSPIPQQCIFARRRLFELYGNFDERYSICADYEWLIRMLNKKVTILQVENYFCYFYSTEINYTQKSGRK